MSGLSSGGCFKCGALGHRAEECPAESRLCYNCKQPGHESASCPNPRTTDGRQCFTCGGVGHIAADCPSTGTSHHNSTAGGGSLAGTKCFTCGQFGHVRRTCTQSSNAGGERSLHTRIGGFIPRPTPSQPVQCHKCLGMNHIARNCMAIQPAPAFPSRYLKPKICFNCQRPGHIASNCPGSGS